jgi:hypothetical protein
VGHPKSSWGHPNSMIWESAKELAPQECMLWSSKSTWMI